MTTTGLCLGVHFFLTSTVHVQLVPRYVSGFHSRIPSQVAAGRWNTDSLLHTLDSRTGDWSKSRAPALESDVTGWRTTAGAAQNLSSSYVAHGQMRWCWGYESCLSIAAKKNTSRFPSLIIQPISLVCLKHAQRWRGMTEGCGLRERNAVAYVWFQWTFLFYI